jgi:hypothetical protein
MKGLLKDLKRSFSTLQKGRFDPTKIGLDKTFSLVKFSTLKG